jgi:hypothetical protein
MGEKISVGPPYYNKVAGPLALILCLVMVAGPLLSWRKDDGKKLWSRLPLAIFAGAAVLFALILFGGKVGILPLLGMTVAGVVAVASLSSAVGTQSAPHAAADMGHGDRAFRRRRLPGRNGRRKRVHQGTAGCRGAGRRHQGRRFCGEVRRRETAGGAELHRDRGHAGGDDIVGQQLHDAARGAHLSGPDGHGADRNQRGGAADAAGRATLCGSRPAGDER